MSGPLHDDEVDTGIGVVRALLRAQVPRLAELPLSVLKTTGTDNAMYRLGSSHLARLPRIAGAAPGLVVELEWLPRLAGRLSTTVPELVHAGNPADNYPFNWAILGWLDGVDAWTARSRDWFGPALGYDLAQLVHDLRATSVEHAPRREPGTRGGPLSALDERVRWWLDRADGLVDVASAIRVWDRCREAADFPAEPVLLHGDLIPGNLLIEGGRLSAVIDWGGLGAGDPALDLIPAWSVLDSTGSAAFREMLAVDSDAWLRARGFALEQALGGVVYYTPRRHPLADVMRRTLDRVLAEQSMPFRSS